MTQAWSAKEEIEGRLDAVFDGNLTEINQWLDSVPRGFLDTPRSILAGGNTQDLNTIICVLSRLSKERARPL